MFLFALLLLCVDAARLLLLVSEGHIPGSGDLAVAAVLLLVVAMALRRRRARHRYEAVAARLAPLWGTGLLTKSNDVGRWLVEDMGAPKATSRPRITGDAQLDRLVEEDTFYHYHWWNKR